MTRTLHQYFSQKNTSFYGHPKDIYRLLYQTISYRNWTVKITKIRLQERAYFIALNWRAVFLVCNKSNCSIKYQNRYSYTYIHNTENIIARELKTFFIYGKEMSNADYFKFYFVKGGSDVCALSLLFIPTNFLSLNKTYYMYTARSFACSLLIPSLRMSC